MQLNILLGTASNFLIDFPHNTFYVNNTFFVDVGCKFNHLLACMVSHRHKSLDIKLLLPQD